MQLKYRYSIAQDESLDFIEVHPIYGDDVTSELERESGQQFFRRKLSGKFRFQGRDYKMITEAPFDTVFNVKIELKYTHRLDSNTEWQHYLSAKFMKIDCDFNLDDKNIITPFEVVDEYNDILSNMDKEYDLMQLAPEREILTIQKRPLLQIYSSGDDVISCFLGGSIWEQNCEKVEDVEVLAGYHFSATPNTQISVTGDATPSDIAGDYEGNRSVNIYTHTNGRYYICRALVEYEVGIIFESGWEFFIKSKVDDTELYKSQFFNKHIHPDPDPLQVLSFSSVTSSSGNITSIGKSIQPVYTRYLLNSETFNNIGTSAISANDIVANNSNYLRAIGINVGSIVIKSDTTTQPTKYGKAPNGEYYAEQNANWHPIGQSQWDADSVWYIPENLEVETTQEESGRSPFSISTYTLSGVIKELLIKVSPNISYEPTIEHSRFLYADDNPISGDDKVTLLIYPKGLLIRGGKVDSDEVYNTSLESIFKMLRDVYKCYWHIDRGKLKIEHIEWFNNGGSYSQAGKQTAIDLTTYMCTRADKPWGFGTSKFSYEKEDIPERFQFKWQDEVSKSFAGKPIEMVSRYVNKGQIEDITISDFTTDVDYVLTNPSEISTSGFVLFAAQKLFITQVLPFVSQTFDGKPLLMQNGYLSWINLQPKYWKYDLPARHVKINGNEVLAATVKRVKTQKVKYPTPFDVDPQKLIKTYLGLGQVDKATTKISTRMNEVTLKYETDDE